MQDKIFGIDLGTTNSCISVLDKNKPRVIPVDGNGIVPSVVSLDKGQYMVGRKALNRSLAYPDESVRSVKRLMGSDKMVRLGSEELRPEEVSAKILAYLRDEAFRLEGHKVKKAVVTVPAYFSDAQRRATIEAGQLADLEVVRIVNEPTAAALFYDLINVGSRESGKKWSQTLVYDLGGGTFDVSILRLSEIIEVISSTGDTMLGGDDFDAVITSVLLDRIRKESKMDLSGYAPAMARLRSAAEAAKIQLSEKGTFLIEESFIPVPEGEETASVSYELHRTDFEMMVDSLLDRTMTYVNKAIEEASLTASTIDRVIMVGGMTRMPIVTQKLAKVFGQSQMPAVDPDLSVSFGAAIQGGIIVGESMDQILVDVTSHTLSTKALVEHRRLECVPIIPRNTSIPATRSRTFFTVADNQQQVLVSIHQGESAKPGENQLIGEKMLKLAPSPIHTQVAVEFSYDLNGVVHVVAEQKGYSRKVELEIDSRNPEAFKNDSLSDMFSEEELNDAEPLTKEALRALLDEAIEERRDSSDYDDDDVIDAEEAPLSFSSDGEDGFVSRSAASSPGDRPAAQAAGSAKPGPINYVVRQAISALDKLPKTMEARNELETLLSRYQRYLFNSATTDEGLIDECEDKILEILDRPEISKLVK